MPEDFQFVTEVDGVRASTACVVIYPRTVGVKLEFSIGGIARERVRFNFRFVHPQVRVPEFVAFDKVYDVTVDWVHEYDFCMGAVRIG